MDDSRFVLSVDKNDLILYTKIHQTDSDRTKYVCVDCIKQGSKRTKRLISALKTKAGLSIKIKIDNGDHTRIKLSVKHPLYDDDEYILRDPSSIQETPDMLTPDMLTPDISTPEQATPEQAISEQAISEQAISEQTTQTQSTLTQSTLTQSTLTQSTLTQSTQTTLTQSTQTQSTQSTQEQSTQTSQEEIQEEDKMNNTHHSKKQPLCYIYVLELEESKYYVGKSSKPLSRTGEHLISNIRGDASCSGAAWTEMYKPIKILRVIVSYDEFDEDLYTFRYMKEHGIDNVRGGSFCELNIPRENIATLGKMLAGAGDRCYFCGGHDHYIAACPQKNNKRTTKKRKQTVVKPKDVPKSRILKYLGTSKLMQNSEIVIEDEQNELNKKNNNTSDEDKYIENKKDKYIKDKYMYRCRFCDKPIETKEKLKTHENIMCKKSTIVQKGKKIEADVDAILEANKKYLKKKN